MESYNYYEQSSQKSLKFQGLKYYQLDLTGTRPTSSRTHKLSPPKLMISLSMCLGISFPKSDSTYCKLIWLNNTGGSYPALLPTDSSSIIEQSPCMIWSLKSWSSGKDIRELCPWTMMERTLWCTINNWNSSKTPRWSLDSRFLIKKTYTISSRALDVQSISSL